MNYIPIHTNIAPNYNYLSAENAYLKQSIEYKDAVICEQQGTINKLHADAQQLSQANMQFKQERDKATTDAARWHVMKKIILSQGGGHQLETVEKVINKELSNDRAGKKGVERRD